LAAAALRRGRSVGRRRDVSSPPASEHDARTVTPRASRWKPCSRKAPERRTTTVRWRFVNRRMKKEGRISLGETASRVVCWSANKLSPARAGRRVSRVVEASAALRRAQGLRFHALSCASFPSLTAPLFAKKISPAPERRSMPSRAKPAFKKDGTVTAASSIGINDGAAAPTCDRITYKSTAICADRDDGSRGFRSELLWVLGPYPSDKEGTEPRGLTSSYALSSCMEAFAAQADCLHRTEARSHTFNIYCGLFRCSAHPLVNGSKLLDHAWPRPYHAAPRSSVSDHGHRRRPGHRDDL